MSICMYSGSSVRSKNFQKSMKRSAERLQETCDEIECNFKNALSGENYDKKMLVSKENTGSSLLLKFCRINDFCIYQIKLSYGDKVLDNEKSLKSQFITEQKMTFEVTKEQNTSINIKKLKWRFSYPDDGDHTALAILPKAKTLNVEHKYFDDIIEKVADIEIEAFCDDIHRVSINYLERRTLDSLLRSERKTLDLDILKNFYGRRLQMGALKEIISCVPDDYLVIKIEEF